MKKSKLVRLVSIIKEEVEKEIGNKDEVIDSVPIRILTFKDVERLYRGVTFNKGKSPNVPSTKGGAMESIPSEKIFDRWKKDFVAKYGTEGELALVKMKGMYGSTNLKIVGNSGWEKAETGVSSAISSYYASKKSGDYTGD